MVKIIHFMLIFSTIKFFIVEIIIHFFYNEKLQALIGKKSNKKYMFGDSVTIEVISASKETGLIDFALVNENGDKGGNSK